MPVPPIFYKSTNIVLHENHKGTCSGQMVPTPKIYSIGSWTKYNYSLAFVAVFKRATDEGSLPEIAQYSPYYLPLNVLIASKGSNLYILFAQNLH